MDEMTVTEAAAELGVHRTRVWQYIKQGLLPARQVGPLWVVRRDAVRELKEHPLARGRPRKRPGGADGKEA